MCLHCQYFILTASLQDKILAELETWDQRQGTEEMQRKVIIGDSEEFGFLHGKGWRWNTGTCALLISLLANSFNVTPCKALLHAASSLLVSFSLSCLAGFKLVLWLTLKLCL